MTQDIRFDWNIIRKALEDNWFETNPTVSDSELDETSIGVAGVVDEHIKNIKIYNKNKIKNFVSFIEPFISGVQYSEEEWEDILKEYFPEIYLIESSKTKD